MTDTRGLQDLWLRAVDLNVRYYSGLSRLAAEYWKDLASMLATTQGAVSPQASRPPGAASAHTSGAGTAASSSAEAPAVIVLEGESGHTAIGVFLLGNSFPVPVSASVRASAVVDENGRDGNVAFSFDPSVITLKPGEQILVRVSAAIDPALEPLVSYRGELSIPELGATRIPVVVRRRPSTSKNVPDAGAS